MFVVLSGLIGSAAIFAQSVNGVVNPAAVNQNNVIAPGSLVSIFGGSLAGSLASADSATLSSALGDVSAVRFNGIAAPLVMVSDGQINAQVPWEVTPGMATVTVSRGDVTTDPFNVQVNQFAPAIFGFRIGGMQAIAINGDGSMAATAGFLGNLAAHPAAAGDTLTFYATGLGPVNGGLASGALPGGTSNTTTSTPTVTIGNVPAEVTYSGMSPQFFGVYQLNVKIPGGVPTGKAVPVQIQIEGVTNNDPVTIAVQ
jgi:uncharacterized protein (TIGR03437 family)